MEHKCGAKRKLLKSYFLASYGTESIVSAEEGPHLVAELTGHEMEVNSIVFSPDGHLIVTRSDDGTARIWRVYDGKMVEELTGHSRWVQSVAFSHDGRLIATESSDKTVQIWRVTDGKLVKKNDRAR